VGISFNLDNNRLFVHAFAFPVIAANNSVLLLFACAHEISLKYIFPEQNAIS
jgi:hypothetical protein